MSILQKIALSLVLVPTGLIAGLQTLMLMGVLPALQRMPLPTYVGAWQAMDHFMAVRMPILVNATFVLYLFAMACFARFPNRWIFWTLLGCFALLVTDTVFTVRQQLPINRAVQALHVARPDDAGRANDAASLETSGQAQQLRDATIQHFHLRAWLAIVAFVWLVVALIFALHGREFNAL